MKAEWSNLLYCIEKGMVQRYTKADLDRLRDYVDMLETALRTIRETTVEALDDQD